jgi:hypothetical protein
MHCPEGGFSVATHVWRTRETALSESVFHTGWNYEPPSTVCKAGFASHRDISFRGSGLALTNYMYPSISIVPLRGKRERSMSFYDELELNPVREEA